MSEKLLEVRDLRVSYKTGKSLVHAVNGISFSINTGETLGLVGETGAGKTTTALAILQLLPERTGVIEDGQVIYRGEDLLLKNKKEMRNILGAEISMIFQDPMTSLNPINTIRDQIMESLLIHNTEKKSIDELDTRIDDILRLVEIQPRRKNEYPHQFSGGMKQRVMIAISLACNPALIIADEPTTALDVTIQAQVMNLIWELKETLSTSMIMITHDLGIVAQTCDRVAVMYAGEIVEFGTTKDIFEGEYHHPYTAGLFECIPVLEKDTRRLTPIEGLIPDPTNLPGGCKFHPRCKSRTNICDKVLPPQVQLGSHRIACHLFSKEH